jgi:RNA polymerase-binding transcription factor DksA
VKIPAPAVCLDGLMVCEEKAMDASVRRAFEQKLRKERHRLWEEASAADSELLSLGESRESELEEAAQQERWARVTSRLDVRAKHEIEDIDAALMRLADNRYGKCLACGRRIPIARLQALPATRFCMRCAREQRPPPPTGAVEVAPVRHPGAVPAGGRLLSDREVESELRELVRQDGRVDMEELRIVCRHGVVRLDGALPSEAEHNIVRRLITDHVGMQEIADSVRIDEVSWERTDRSQEGQVAELGSDMTTDIVKSSEEGLDYVAPELPPEPEG